MRLYCRLSFFEEGSEEICKLQTWRISERQTYPKYLLMEIRRITRVLCLGILTTYIGKPLVPPLMQRTGHIALSGISERPRVAR